MSNSKPSQPITCGHCGNTFLVTKDRANTAKFCSKICHGGAKQAAALKTQSCLFCRTDFTVANFKLKGGRRKYCSAWCGRKHIRVRHKVVKKCERCGETFVCPTGTDARPERIYCSHLCSARDMHGHCKSIPKDQPVGHIDKDGYFRLCLNGKHIARARYVMQEYLGRELTGAENVHHRNGVRDDDRIENLELWSSSQPYGQRIEDKVAHAREILKLYADYVPPPHDS